MIEESATTVSELGPIGVLGVVVLGLIALVVTFGRKILGEQAQTNKAVNNVGAGKDPMTDRLDFLLEEVSTIKGWMDDFNRNGWATLPNDLATSSALTDTIRKLQREVQVAMERMGDNGAKLEATLAEVKAMRAELEKHVRWEEMVKYGVHGDDDGEP